MVILVEAKLVIDSNLKPIIDINLGSVAEALHNYQKDNTEDPKLIEIHIEQPDLKLFGFKTEFIFDEE